MWYKQARQYSDWEPYEKWKRCTKRLESKLSLGEDIPEEEINKLLFLTDEAFGNTGDLQAAREYASTIKRKWKSLQRRKRKEEQQQEIEPESEIGVVASYTNLKKSQENTIGLKKEEYKTIEDIVSKVASEHEINNVSCIDITLSKTGGIAQFKVAEREHTALTEWKHPSDYMGETYEGYYIVVGRSRDSDALENSNFETALEMLGGEDEEAGVIVAKAGHWAVGWVEELLVSKNAPEKVAIAEQIEKKLDNYPVLNEEDFSRREYEEMSDMADQTVTDILRDIEIKYDADKTIFPEEKKEELRQIVFDNIEGHGGQSYDEKELFQKALIIFKEELTEHLI